MGGGDRGRSKPIVAAELLAGRTTWIVYGTKKRIEGTVIGIPSQNLFRRVPARL